MKFAKENIPQQTIDIQDAKWGNNWAMFVFFLKHFSVVSN